MEKRNLERLKMDKKRELVLRSPQMFIGREWNADGLYFLVHSVMRLAIQPMSANLCSNLEVVIEDETVEYVFSGIFSTNPLPPYYQDFGFLNYLGFVLSAVSEHLRVETNFEGNRYELTCAKGKIVKHLQKVMTSTAPNKGTQLTFTPDSEVFPNFKFDFEELLTGLRDLKHEYPGVKLILEDKKLRQRIEVQN